MSADSSAHNDSRSTKPDCSSFPASPDPDHNSQLNSIHFSNRDDSGTSHRLTSRIPSTSALIAPSTSSSTSVPLSNTPAPSSCPGCTKNTLPSKPD